MVPLPLVFVLTSSLIASPVNDVLPNHHSLRLSNTRRRLECQELSHGGICLCLPYGRVSGRLAAGSVDSVTDSAFEVGVIISGVDEIIAPTQLQPCQLPPQGSHSITDGLIPLALVRAAVTGTSGRQAAVTVTVQNARNTPAFEVASYRLGNGPN